MDDIEGYIKGKEILLFKIALDTKDYDIIVALITIFIHFTIRYDKLSDFIKDILKEDEYLKSRLKTHKQDKNKDELLWNKVDIRNWIINAIILDRDNKINKILNDQS